MGWSSVDPQIKFVGYYRAILEFKVERGCNEVPFDLEQLLRERDELLFGETAMSIIHGLSKRKGYAGTDADQRRLLDAEFRRDLVGSAETDAADVPSQAVWVFRDELNGSRAISLVDAHRPRCPDAVAVQEQHDLGSRTRGIEFALTSRWREVDSNPRSHHNGNAFRNGAIGPVREPRHDLGVGAR